MKTSHKLAAIAGAFCLGATLAVPIWTSRQVDERLQAWAQKPAHQSDVQLRKLQHQAGFLSSSGTAELVVRSRCSDDADEQAGMVVQVSYQISHLPRPSGLNAFSWKMSPQGEAATAFKALFGTQDALTGQGYLSWSRQIESDVRLPAMSLAEGGGSIEASPSLGALTVGDKRVAFSWNLDDAQLRSPDFVARVQGLALSMDLDNWQRGTGTASFKVQRISTRDSTLEGLSIESTSSEKDGRLDSVLRQHLDRIQAGQREVKDVAFDLALRGMHADSVEKLTQLFSQSCGIERMTQAERQVMRDAMRTLISQGMSLHLDKLKGRSTQGALEGDLAITLKPANQSSAIRMAELLTTSGHVTLQGDLVSPDLRQMATAMGWGRIRQDSLESSFHYERGQLKILDKLVDATGLQHALAVADTVILALLEDRVPPDMATRELEDQEQAEAESDPEEAFVDDTAPDATEATPAPEETQAAPGRSV